LVSAQRSLSSLLFARTSDVALQLRRHDPVVTAHELRRQKEHDILVAVEKTYQLELELASLFRRSVLRMKAR
jgi:hypothetical protein